MARPQKRFNPILSELIRNIVWAQWNRMGLNGTGGINRYSVDIESALIASGYGSRLDGRLYEGVWAWLQRYGSLVNAERLAILISQRNDEWIARFLGALLENVDSSQWKRVIQRCKKLCSQSWEETPLLINAVRGRWRDKDIVMSKWGILYDRLTPSQKMQDHGAILCHNLLMRYRYLYGTVIRADVIYLLSASHHSRLKREIDCLTSVRLADRLCCHLSTIHRIQKDFEKGGFIESVGEVKKKRSLMSTWLVKDLSFLQRHQDYDFGMIDWIKINALLSALFKLNVELEVNQNEAILKTRIQEFQTDYFPVLMDHEVSVTRAYGMALGPLEEYSMGDFFKTITEALLMFYRMMCCIA